MNNLLLTALNKKYSLGAFNFNNMEVLQAIIEAANEQNFPVIAQISKGAIEYAGAEFMKGLISAGKKIAQVPICFHLDHGDSLELVKTAISIGCDSVMIDASALDFESNIKLTKQVVDYAHKKDIWVEAELGKLAGIEDHVKVDKKDSKFTDPKQAQEFVKRTGVDSLAVAIGTSHGAYKFEGEAKLRFDILKKIQKLIPKTPLVLHGASSVSKTAVDKFNSLGGQLGNAKGIPEEMLKKASKTNVCKINVDTDLRLAFTSSIYEYIKNNPKNIDPRKYLQYAKKSVKDVVISKIKLFGATK